MIRPNSTGSSGRGPARTLLNETRIVMGMPVSARVVCDAVRRETAARAISEVFDYFKYVDGKFSTYKTDSEISRVNRNEIQPDGWSDDMREIMALSRLTKDETGGRFDIVNRTGLLDPSGIVKGWAIANAASIIRRKGLKDFLVDAGGDIQAGGVNEEGRPWSVGIRNPFDQNEIVRKVTLADGAIATSGTYVRGQHIYDPMDMDRHITDIVSLTVIGRNIYDADRFATAAFAMGKNGISFIENRPGLEGYMISADGMAVMTSGFESCAAGR